MEQETLRVYTLITGDPHLRAALRYIAWGDPERFAAAAKAVLLVMGKEERFDMDRVDWGHVYQRFQRDAYDRPR